MRLTEQSRKLIQHAYLRERLDWIGLCSFLRTRQHSIGYIEDDFYRSEDPTNSIKVLKEEATKENLKNYTTKYTNTK